MVVVVVRMVVVRMVVRMVVVVVMVERPRRPPGLLTWLKWLVLKVFQKDGLF